MTEKPAQTKLDPATSGVVALGVVAPAAPTTFPAIVEGFTAARPVLGDLKRDLYESGEHEAHQLVLELELAQAKLAYALGGLTVKYLVSGASGEPDA